MSSSQMTLQPNPSNTNINTLPPELLTQICTSLPRSDLRRCRATSLPLQHAASPLLYSTIHLKVNLTSFKRLQEIADHSLLSQHVRHIHYDGRRLYHASSSEPNFREWKRLYAGNGLPSAGDRGEEWIDLFKTGQLLDFYQRYCLYLTGQKYILRFEQILLIAALRKLRGLKGVRYFLKEDEEEGDGSTVPFSGLNPIARDTLVLPSKVYDGPSNNHIWNLLHGVSRAGLANVTEARARDLSLRMWNEVSVRHMDCYNMFSGLEKLEMEFVFERVMMVDTFPLKQVLTHCTNLKELRVGFDTMIFSEVFAGANRGVNFADFVPRERTWEHLNKLALKAVVTTQRELEVFLRRHRGMLRSLELANMLFERDMTIEDPKKRHGSWIDFTRFLNGEMELTSVKFGGHLYNGIDESWYILDDAEAIQKYDCLRRGVERYTTRRGRFPFTTYEAKNGVTMDDISYSVYCKIGKVIWMDDATWRAQSYMLRSEAHPQHAGIDGDPGEDEWDYGT